MATETLAPARADETTLRRFVREHHVWWEAVPRLEWHDDAQVVTGIELRLCARCTAGRAPDPALAECRDAYETLRALVEAAAPASVRWRPRPYDATLHLRPEADLQAEVELVVDILRSAPTFAPLDAVEKSALHELEAALVRLGAPRHGGGVAA